MSLTNPYQQYHDNAILTADQGRLALSLFEGAARFARQAAAHIDKRDFPAAHHSLIRAQDIVEYLASTVNTEIEVGKNLATLYEFILRCLVQANMSKDTDLIKEAVIFLDQLRDTWREALNGKADEGEE
ncbi:MAG: flagellar export chaperone FliS [Bacillota bacterium]